MVVKNNTLQSVSSPPQVACLTKALIICFIMVIPVLSCHALPTVDFSFSSQNWIGLFLGSDGAALRPGGVERTVECTPQ